MTGSRLNFADTSGEDQHVIEAERLAFYMLEQIINDPACQLPDAANVNGDELSMFTEIERSVLPDVPTQLTFEARFLRHHQNRVEMDAQVGRDISQRGSAVVLVNRFVWHTN
jgi:hypothetical protein